MASPRSRYPGPRQISFIQFNYYLRSAYPGPWQGPFIKLNLYLPSGEFVCEHNVYVEDRVWDFLLHLEEGVITPDLEVDDDMNYILVWNGMVLDDNVGFADIVRDHGMSETEPNDITVVKHACGSW